MATDLVEYVLGEPSFSPVFACHSVHNGHCFSLTSPAEQKLGGLEKVEQNKPRKEHHEGHGPHRIDEVCKTDQY